MTDDATKAPSDATGFAALRHRDFTVFFLGKMLANAAYHMVMVALAYQLYDRTGDAMVIAFIGIAMMAPAFLFAPIVGYVCDACDRRLILIACYLLMLAAAGLVFLFSVLEWPVSWTFYLILLMLGTGRAFYNPANSSYVPNLVPPAVFPNAVTWNAMGTKGSQIAGPALGGGLYLLGPEVVYLTAAATFLFGAVTIWTIRARPARNRAARFALQDLMAGLFYVFDKKVLLGAVILDFLVILMGGVQALFPIFAKDILDVGPAGAGVLRSAMAIGGLLAALVVTRVGIRNAGKVMFAGDAVFGLTIVAFGLSTEFWLSVAAVALMGAADMISINVRHTLLQIATPDAMRGRVAAVSALSGNFSNEMGGFRAGSFAAIMGPVAAAVAGGLGTLVIVAACWRAFPSLVKADRLDRAI